MAREIKADTQEILNDTSAIKEDTAQILAEIARLQAQLPRDAQRDHASGFMLERYLDNLTSYAETVHDTLSDNVDERRGSDNGSIKQQRSISPTSRPSSVVGVRNDHAVQSIAPRAPENWKRIFGNPEDYLSLTLEVKALDNAREAAAQERLRRFSTRRRRQPANGHDDMDQPRSSESPEIAATAESRPQLSENNARRTANVGYAPPRAETLPVEQNSASTTPSTNGSSGIKGSREIIHERATEEVIRDYMGGSKSGSTPPKFDQQTTPVSEAAVARDQNVAAHIAQTNSLRSDPQKQINDTGQTKDVYHSLHREPFGAGHLSPGTDQNQSDGNASPQPRSAVLRATNFSRPLRKMIDARRAHRVLRETNDSRERGMDGRNVRDMPTTPLAMSMDIRPMTFNGLYRLKTSSASVQAICDDIIRVLTELGIVFRKTQSGFRCTKFLGGRIESPFTFEFDILLVDVNLISMLGIQFKTEAAEEGWKLNETTDIIMNKLRV